MGKHKSNNSRKLKGLFKFCLSTKGFTITDLAKMHGMSDRSLCNCFYVPFPKAERIVADALNLRPQELWPSRYGEDGLPNRKNAWYARGKTGQRYQKKEIKSKKIGKLKNGTKN